MQKFYRVDEVAKMLSMSRSTIWRLTRENEFPQPTKLSTRTTVWSQSSLEEFIDSKR